MRKPNLLWKHCTCTVGRSISECVSHLEPLGGWKSSTPYYFEPSLTWTLGGWKSSTPYYFEPSLTWASTFFNFHPGGNCLTMLCFLWKWPLWCRLQNFRDATWNSGSSSCPTFPSAGVTRWVVALNLKASIIIIHQARFGVKIPLPPSPESLWKICTIPAPLIGRQSLITSPDLFNSNAYQPAIQHCFSFITNQHQPARNHPANRTKRGEWQVPCQLQAAAKFLPPFAVDFQICSSTSFAARFMPGLVSPKNFISYLIGCLDKGMKY
jgi:hypothetical protein